MCLFGCCSSAGGGDGERVQSGFEVFYAVFLLKSARKKRKQLDCENSEKGKKKK